MSLDKRKKSKKGERIKNEGRKYIKVTKDPKTNVKQITRLNDIQSHDAQSPKEL